jgi:RIO-like serine/threonine protein kinase
LIGCRVNGLKVAAKMVFAYGEAWVKEEIENERQSLEVLNSLQGCVIVEKVFAGKINEGEYRLLVTKFVEGTRLDKVQMTEEVAANARSALEEIHRTGYIHGDVVARNIIVQPSG